VAAAIAGTLFHSMQEETRWSPGSHAGRYSRLLHHQLVPSLESVQRRVLSYAAAAVPLTPAEARHGNKPWVQLRLVSTHLKSHGGIVVPQAVELLDRH
jgi:hypothetical protein